MSNQFFTIQENYRERFFQLPKVFFTNENYKKMSNDAKISYAILKDRLELSIQNNWIDKDGNIYFIYTVKQLEDILNCGNQKVNKIKKELEEVNLLIQKRQGLNKPNLLYLLRPEITESDIYTISEEEKKAKPLQDKEMLKSHVRKCENHTSGNVKITRQDVLKSHANDTELSDTEFNDTELNDTNDMNDINDDRKQFRQNLQKSLKQHSNHTSHYNSTNDDKEFKEYTLQEFPKSLKEYICNFTYSDVEIIKSIILKAKQSFHDERADEINVPYRLEDFENELIDVLKRFKVKMKKKNETVEDMQSYLFNSVKNEFINQHVFLKQRANFSRFNIFAQD